MWRVAGCATLGFDHRMLVDKGTCCLSVAFGANVVLVRRRLQHLALECPMRVMAIVALHQSFLHPVMEGLCK